MTEREQNEPEQIQMDAILAHQKTYGERKFDFLLNTVLNFWVNLFVSGAFTFWVSHKHEPIKLPFGKRLKPPPEIQRDFAKTVHDMPFMKVFDSSTDVPGGVSNRQKYANNAASVFTMTNGGHVVVIPSVWLMNKYKDSIVEWFDRRHYGAAGKDSQFLAARHAAIEAEERPTLFGAVIGRIGSLVSTQAASYIVGNPSNLISTIGKKLNIDGLKRFSGVDSISGVVGDKTGEAITQMLPETTSKFDEHLVKNGYGWSYQQSDKHPHLLSQPYHGATQHISKYLAQDLLYTGVTAVAVMPIINTLKRFIPGMTYTPKPKHHANAVQAAPALKRTPEPIDLYATAPTAEAAAASDQPRTNIREVHNESTLHPRAEQALVSAG